MIHTAYIPFVTLRGQRCVPPNLRVLRAGLTLRPTAVYTQYSDAHYAAVQQAGDLRQRYQTAITGVAHLRVEYDTTAGSCTVQSWCIDHEEWPLCADLGWAADCKQVERQDNAFRFLIRLWKVAPENGGYKAVSPEVEHWVDTEDDITQFCANGRPSVRSLLMALRKEYGNAP